MELLTGTIMFGNVKSNQIEIDLFDIFRSHYKVTKNTNPREIEVYYDNVQKSFVILSRKSRTAINCQIPHTFYCGCSSRFEYYNFEITINMKSCLGAKYYR